MNFKRVSALLILAFLLASCAHKKTKISNTEDLGRLETPETPPVVPLNPRIIDAELILEIFNIKVLNGTKLKQNNRKRGVPELSAPQLHVWSSDIVQRQNQTILELDMDGPAPSDIFSDAENGNQILYWNLTEELGKQDRIVIKRRVKIEAYELLSIVNPGEIPSYDPYDEDYQSNTKYDRFLELTPVIREAAANIVGEEDNPYFKAKMIHEWVNSNMRFKYPPGERGAAAAIKKLRGDSGQFADLFVALCRAAGVPARTVSGFHINEKEVLKSQIWAEFYLPEHGWIPADPTKDLSNFGRLDNRIVASIGRNIDLRHVPHWATFSNSEVENWRTGYMQNATIVFSGILAKFRTSIKTLGIEEPKLLSTEEER